MTALSRDQRYMRRALDLAIQGLGRVEPNPMVGAVVVVGDRIVGEGFHARFGGPHAEVVALEQAGPAARGAELFVSLEPCCHWGKTPPCTTAILAAGLRRVVAAVSDPFPQVAGKGLEILRQAGVETHAGVLEDAARHLNGAFFKRVKTGLPLVIAKWAMTLDGRIAVAPGAGASAADRWISSEESRRRVHEVRRACDAVVIGAGTAVADEPQLTVRHCDPLPERGQPARVILDGRLVIDPAKEPARSARQTPVIIYTTAEAIAAQAARAKALRDAGCQLVPVPPFSPRPTAGEGMGVWGPSTSPFSLRPAEGEGTGVRGQSHGVSLEAVLADMGTRGWSRVLVEGGPKIFGSLFAAHLADRVMIFIAPRILAASVA
ncbi:MAG: bifunctional diaminohydroxyphosphoribosylaminopyrimidine deaminase/5-amino-6-(5-phosphoribosylamino)uracil reductase RibD, partial [Planctomycetota bacterium]|nr:bifunctional diaminohydroxyphosphoribosylaminopyrimidine deaminase/5-amino-6-(5-phosphoribosylamino)uracil reductase RibD [Planctomycetota bacterium]